MTPMTGVARFEVLLTVGDVAELTVSAPGAVFEHEGVMVVVPAVEIDYRDPVGVDGGRLAAELGVSLGDLPGLRLVWTGRGFRVAG